MRLPKKFLLYVNVAHCILQPIDHSIFDKCKRLILITMLLNLSQRQLNNYVINLVLFSVVILSWVYVILAGKFISERHLNTLDMSDFGKDEGSLEIKLSNPQ